jgi:hypothetical protein
MSGSILPPAVERAAAVLLRLGDGRGTRAEAAAAIAALLAHVNRQEELMREAAGKIEGLLEELRRARRGGGEEDPDPAL